jgi:thiol:disulfide interchange protein DsbD
MFKIIFILLIGLTSTLVFSQENPVKWNVSESEDGKNKFIKVTAKMEDNWHIYSMNLKEEFGPIPTTITFSENDDVQYLGKIEEEKPKREKDANFDMVIDYFDVETDFLQKIKVSKETTVKVSIYYMCCNDKKCLPPKEEIIEIKLK